MSETTKAVIEDILIKTTDPIIVKAGAPAFGLFGIPIVQISEAVGSYGAIATTALSIVALIYVIIGRHLAAKKTNLEKEGLELENRHKQLQNMMLKKEAEQKGVNVDGD